MILNLSQKWEKTQLEKRLRELKKAGIELTLENIPRIIEEMSFRVKSKKQQDDCPYYRTEKPCHPEIKELNCFLCACPQYESFKLEGGCKIKSKLGKWAYHKHLPAGKVWGCSNCAAYHHPKSVEIYLRKNINKLREISSHFL